MDSEHPCPSLPGPTPGRSSTPHGACACACLHGAPQPTATSPARFTLDRYLDPLAQGLAPALLSASASLLVSPAPCAQRCLHWARMAIDESRGSRQQRGMDLAATLRPSRCSHSLAPLVSFRPLAARLFFSSPACRYSPPLLPSLTRSLARPQPHGAVASGAARGRDASAVHREGEGVSTRQRHQSGTRRRRKERRSQTTHTRTADEDTPPEREAGQERTRSPLLSLFAACGVQSAEAQSVCCIELGCKL